MICLHLIKEGAGLKSKTTKLGYARRLGQFFSPPVLVERGVSLIKNHGRLLEPSCGNGAFAPAKAKSTSSVFIEIDERVAPSDALVMDFFDYPLDEKFDTIIGNPPYVDNAFFKVKHKTGIKCQANLYLYFIEKCYHHLADGGELILVAPREFIKQTSARYVNNLLCDHGTITHYLDYGDEKLFAESCQNVCIFRYEKGNMSRVVETLSGVRIQKNNDGLISFVKESDDSRIDDFFEVKVGAVAGNDSLFEHAEGVDFVFSKTRKTGELKKRLYRTYHKDLERYKEVLIKRKIKTFSEENWYDWGRPVNFREGQPRIYVNCRTRIKDPFFTNSCDRWDGSLLALFPKKAMDLDKAVKILNSIDWNSLGFMTGGRYIFSQKSLKETPINGKLFE